MAHITVNNNFHWQKKRIHNIHYPARIPKICFSVLFFFFFCFALQNVVFQLFYLCIIGRLFIAFKMISAFSLFFTCYETSFFFLFAETFVFFFSFFFSCTYFRLLNVYVSFIYAYKELEYVWQLDFMKMYDFSA